MTSIFWRKTARCRKKKKKGCDVCRQVHWSLNHSAACDWAIFFDEKLQKRWLGPESALSSRVRSELHRKQRCFNR